MDANTDERDAITPAARTKTWWLCALVRAICAESAHQRTRTTSRQDLTKPQSHKARSARSRDQPARYAITSAARTKTWWLSALVRAICTESAHLLPRTANHDCRLLKLHATATLHHPPRLHIGFGQSLQRAQIELTTGQSRDVLDPLDQFGHPEIRIAGVGELATHIGEVEIEYAQQHQRLAF
jgi:hypothetical protein